MNMERSIYQQKQDYVKELNGFLSAHPDFKRIDYVRLYRVDEEYIKMDFITGPIVINVTGNSILAIAVEIGRFVAGQKLDSMTTNVDKLRAIDKILRTGGQLA